MQTGVIQLNNQMYYLDPVTGVMAADTDLTLNGINYRADANGICTKIVEDETTADGTALEENNASSESETTTPETQAPTGPGDLLP